VNYKVEPKEQRGSEHLYFYETDTGNMISCRLRRQVLKTWYLRRYARNEVSRLLREKDKKCDISPSTRGQETRYLGVYEIRLSEAGETYYPTWKRKEDCDCVSIAWKLFASNFNTRI